MARDWSAAQQATQNLAAQRDEEAKNKIKELFQNDIAGIANALDFLNGLQVDDNDVDLLAAIRALGALKARIERKLYKHTEVKAPF